MFAPQLLRITAFLPVFLFLIQQQWLILITAHRLRRKLIFITLVVVDDSVAAISPLVLQNNFVKVTQQTHKLSENESNYKCCFQGNAQMTHYAAVVCMRFRDPFNVWKK